MSKLLISLISLNLLFSCSNINNSEKVFDKNFKRYLKEVHQINTDTITDKIFYLINTNICSDCIEKNIETIVNATNNNLIVVKLGKGVDDRLKIYNYLEDYNNKYDRYLLEFNKSLIVHIKDGKIIYSLSPKDYELDDVLKYINSN